MSRALNRPKASRAKWRICCHFGRSMFFTVSLFQIPTLKSILLLIDIYPSLPIQKNNHNFPTYPSIRRFVQHTYLGWSSTFGIKNKIGHTVYHTVHLTDAAMFYWPFSIRYEKDWLSLQSSLERCESMSASANQHLIVDKTKLDGELMELKVSQKRV